MEIDGERPVLDPDQSVQGAIHQFFETFRRTASATATVRSFRERGLLFPRRVQSGPHKGEIFWGELLHYRALNLLKNPRYAGPSPMDAHKPKSRSKAPGRAIACHASSGTPSPSTLIRATSLGPITRTTWLD